MVQAQAQGKQNCAPRWSAEFLARSSECNESTAERYSPRTGTLADNHHAIDAPDIGSPENPTVKTNGMV